MFQAKQESRTAKSESETSCLETVIPLQVVWRNVFLFAYLHGAAVYGAYLLLSGQVPWNTVLWNTGLFVLIGLGITAGAHRLWSHKSYKAETPLRLLLALFQTLTSQNSIHEWARDHRLHHKYSETNADPHNATRGFFFAHMGWLLVRKHPDVKVKGSGIDLSDLETDPIVMWQKKFYLPLVLLVAYVMPTVVPVFLWGERPTVAWHMTLLRLCVSLHFTWLVNSAAHLWGRRPYDKKIKPAENKMVSLVALGEGFHNYHHTFPWDYKTAEFGLYRYNVTTAFIDAMAWIGWAYDLKSVPKNVVHGRAQRTGDGTWTQKVGSLGEWE